MDNTPKKVNGRRNRSAGHSFETALAQAFRDNGFEHVRTSRQVSPMRDAQKIDLANFDEFKNGRFQYNIQAKCCQGTIQYRDILLTLPVEENIINVVVHKRTKKSKSRFMVQGEYAFLELKDFMALTARLQKLEQLALAAGQLIQPQ